MKRKTLSLITAAAMILSLAGTAGCITIVNGTDATSTTASETLSSETKGTEDPTKQSETKGTEDPTPTGTNMTSSETEKETESATETEKETETAKETEKETEKETIKKTNQVLLPDSSTTPVTSAMLSGLSKGQLRFARNEIYARHGRRFKSAELQEYFDHQEWYNGIYDADSFDENLLSDLEQRNVTFINLYEQSSTVADGTHFSLFLPEEWEEAYINPKYSMTGVAIEVGLVPMAMIFWDDPDDTPPGGVKVELGKTSAGKTVTLVVPLYCSTLRSVNESSSHDLSWYYMYFDINGSAEESELLAAANYQSGKNYKSLSDYYNLNEADDSIKKNFSDHIVNMIKEFIMIK